MGGYRFEKAGAAHGATALHVAVETSRGALSAEFANALLDAGAHPDAPDSAGAFADATQCPCQTGCLPVQPGCARLAPSQLGYYPAHLVQASHPSWWQLPLVAWRSWQPS